MVVNEESWHNGITKEWWGQVDWDSIRENQDLAKNFDKEICSKIYLGGIEAPLRAQVFRLIIYNYFITLQIIEALIVKLDSKTIPNEESTSL